MNTEIIIALIGIIATGCSSFFTWLFAKKKYNAEVDHQVVENMQQSLDFYIKLSEDNSKRLDEYRKEITELQTQVLYLKRNICFKEYCTEREDIAPIQSKPNKRNGSKAIKSTDKKEITK